MGMPDKEKYSARMPAYKAARVRKIRRIVMGFSVMSHVLNQIGLEKALKYLSGPGVDSIEFGAGVYIKIYESVGEM